MSSTYPDLYYNGCDTLEEFQDYVHTVRTSIHEFLQAGASFAELDYWLHESGIFHVDPVAIVHYSSVLGTDTYTSIYLENYKAYLESCETYDHDYYTLISNYQIYDLVSMRTLNTYLQCSIPDCKTINSVRLSFKVVRHYEGDETVVLLPETTLL